MVDPEVKNCFLCDEVRSCYVTTAFCNECIWKSVANNDLNKYESGVGVIRLPEMLQAYLKYKAETEDTRILSQEEIDEFRKELEKS